MPSLADTQRVLRWAVVTGDASDVAPLLVGGRDAEKRFAIHHRNYESSLVTALLGKFPATAWLIGTRFITEAAQRFVYEHPPEAPCIAEYGERFPQFLSICPSADRAPYVRDFAELEWRIGQVSVAVDRQPLLPDCFSTIDGQGLIDARLTLQEGVRYIQASWPIDDLMKLYLTDAAPDHLTFEPADVWIEIRGARGEFQINRLDADSFRFREAILDGQSVGDAAQCALDLNEDFDPGRALVRLAADGLVIAATSSI